MVRLEQITTSNPINDSKIFYKNNDVTQGANPLLLAHEELSDFQNESLHETMEDLGFALGGRIRDLRRGKTDDELVKGRVLMQKLVTEVSAIEPLYFNGLFSEPNDWHNSTDLLSALQIMYPDPGKAALHLVSYLAHGRINNPLRKKFEAALSILMAEENIVLSLFSHLEFGTFTPSLRNALTVLYQKSYVKHQKLSQWLSTLGSECDRKRKLLTMIRLLSYELSASGQPIVDSHLASVISDLRQLLNIIGLDDFCNKAALSINIPEVSGESMLSILVTLIELDWVSSEIIAENLPILDNSSKRLVVFAFSKLIQLIPVNCFSDEDHKTQLQDAFDVLRDCLIEEEEEEEDDGM